MNVMQYECVDLTVVTIIYQNPNTRSIIVKTVVVWHIITHYENSIHVRKTDVWV